MDTRPAAQFSVFSLPGAVNIPTRELFGKTWRDRLSRRGDLKVVFSDTEDEAAIGALVATRLGFENIAVLQGGLHRLRGDILDPTARRASPPGIDPDTREFRAAACPRIAALIKERGKAKFVQRTVKWQVAAAFEPDRAVVTRRSRPCRSSGPALALSPPARALHLYGRARQRKAGDEP